MPTPTLKKPLKNAFQSCKICLITTHQNYLLSAFLFNILICLLQVAATLQLQSSHLVPLPPPPPIGNFQQLARSPASALLANSFFDFERQRESPNHQVALQRQHQHQQIASESQLSRPIASRKQQTALASNQPQFSSNVESFRLDAYHPIEELQNYFKEIARRNDNVQLFTIGRTHEGRPVQALEIINNSTDSDYVWLDALTHAREWITGSTMVYIIDQILAKPEPRATIYRKNYIIVPIVNPDGYAYTWTNNRMWRKNRSRSSKRSAESKCIGADLNRNFDHSFGGEGASLDPCSHIYAGAYAFSEPETKSMADLLWSLKDRVKFYLTIHSYNQLWACPYAHTMEPSKSVEKHMRVLRNIQQAVYAAENERYEIGPLSTKLYVGSGFGIDFAYDKCQIEHSYLVELRDKGANGFVLPPDQIMPTARETLAGLQAGLRTVFG